MVIVMSYKDIIIEPSYETTGIKTQLLEEFYIPMLEQTSYYFRIAGFFSSTSLAIASKGIEGLIHNNGKMRLLISPKISEEEFIILKEQKHLKEDMSIFSNFDIKDFLSCDHLKAFAWMLANDRLEIKIVVDKNNKNSLFHQKVGIGYDLDGNILSFSGSINETAQAWLSNIEEFKTFKSWENGQMVYVLSDLKKFNAYWNDERKDTADVYDIPESIKNKIIQVAPYDINDIEIMRKYKNGNKQMNNTISLFEHQKKQLKNGKIMGIDFLWKWQQERVKPELP